MIYGIGHDILEINRVEQLLSRSNGQAFMQRVLTSKEYELAQRRGPKTTEFAAGRFAAKEAIVKAFGCGIGAIIGFGDIEIIPNDLGKPMVELSKQAWENLNLPGQSANYAIHLSITHQRELASAFAVIERVN
ncbi:holo-ACP synthase [Paenibacillus macquariensis]|uniref:Holo-[acyl-carrier-protein] synthase n=1 Tax=Paenibacillus macquariensis TaxID=948756 RepID=A0ABY1K8M1_9BACL|nr:holo-ACP synthase [Paenibacillus macquariensis]MEC0093290.1 holo-ACP synthase [Paenibacillus macquariensis]OAB27548.1 4'-phosphopantetheinyl transferase [Paenibacillus macquariensis subsp. macquariensis]SIR41388.1 holo-[acyl-carrier protein] synthase [Paenibacillus macquariensis]